MLLGARRADRGRAPSATIRETARRLWVLYLALTLVAIAVFPLYGWTGADPAMNLYQATALAFSTSRSAVLDPE